MPVSLNRWNYVGGNSVNLLDPSGYCTPTTCYVFYFPGGGNTGEDLDHKRGYDWADVNDSLMEDLMTRLSAKAHVTVIPLFSFGAEDTTTDGLLSNLSIVRGEAYKNGNLAEAKVQEIRSKSGADLCFRVLDQLSFIGYSLGGQIAYSTAQAMTGIHPVDKLVTMGAAYHAYNGLNNIGELWELWGETDLTGDINRVPGKNVFEKIGQVAGGLLYTGTDRRKFNDGYSYIVDDYGYDVTGGSIHLDKTGPSIYDEGATRCIFHDGSGLYRHGSYVTKDELDGGISCFGGSSYQRTANGKPHVDAMLDFLIDVVGIGKGN
jgi:hypothetical protein